MPLEIRERELPGVGIRYEVDLTADESIATVIHNTGRRDLYHRATSDEDYERVATLSDSQARALGLVLVGAYYQPVSTRVGDVSPTDERTRWYQVSATAPAAGERLDALDVTARTGGAVLAVVRGDERIDDPPDDLTFREGDNVVTIGDQTAHGKIESMFHGGD